MATAAKKLGIQSGTVVGIDGLEVAEGRRLLEDPAVDVTLRARDGSPVDQLILVADSIATLRSQIVGAWDEVTAGGRLWVWYRKGATRGRAESGEVPLHRDTLQSTLEGFGLVGVTLISVDEAWSSMRVRPL